MAQTQSAADCILRKKERDGWKVCLAGIYIYISKKLKGKVFNGMPAEPRLNGHV